MPRVPMIERREDVPPGGQAAWDVIAETRRHVIGPFCALLHSPEQATRIGHLGAHIRFQSPLAPAVRELAILSVARAMDCRFEWAAHVPIAQQAGVRDEAIAAVRDRKAPAITSLRGCPDNPTPGPGPIEPTLTPGPGPTEKLSNLGSWIVEEAADRTPEQAEILTDPDLRAWAETSAARFRVVDHGAVNAAGERSELLRPWDAWRSSAGNQSAPLPVLLLVRSDGSVYRGGPLPASSAAVKAWIESQTGG